MRLPAFVMVPALVTLSLVAQTPKDATLQPVCDQIRARHAESVKRCRTGLRCLSIAAEGLIPKPGRSG
ncbi:MAG: hypothetical protein IPL96_17825 [Holophagaceae bacterium]|nr:hypothetical protein [Holophagaceae bacterium]